MTDSTQVLHSYGCLGRTCLKWGQDGELTPLDRSLVLERLAQVDQQLITSDKAQRGTTAQYD